MLKLLLSLVFCSATYYSAYALEREGLGGGANNEPPRAVIEVENPDLVAHFGWGVTIEINWDAVAREEAERAEAETAIHDQIQAAIAQWYGGL